MGPSGALFLDRDEVYRDARAKRRAIDLYELVRGAVREDMPGIGCGREADGLAVGMTADAQSLTQWHIVAEVAEVYPKLLVWLAEGKVSALRNVFGLLIAVTRLLPGTRGLLQHLVFEKVTRRTPWWPALYKAVLQEELREKNRRQLASRGAASRFPDDDTMIAPRAGQTGLNSETDVTVPHHTTTRDELRKKIVAMSSGCIGVSGLRGSGKSTLIRDLCEHRYGTPKNLPIAERTEFPLRGLRFVIHAPLRFDPREFVIHLYSCLCEAVLADPWFNRPSFGGNVLGPVLAAPVRPAVVVRRLLFVVMLVAAALLGWSASIGHRPAAPAWLTSDAGDWWEWAGMAAALLVALAIAGRRTRDALLEAREIIHLGIDAERRLRRLHFQRTYTLNLGGSVSAPFGTGLTIGKTSELAEQIMTLPELIDDYRDFAERVVAALQEKEASNGQAHEAEQGDDDTATQQDVRLVIGIDEMDRIASAEDACQFLDEISALFGTVNCVYLIAVAPDALAAASEQAVPLKTSSGGVFDDMVWIDPLPLDEAAQFLDNWVSAMPAILAALCHVLSGGLPRELSRIVRSVIGAKSPANELRLADVTRRVVDEEIQALRHRAMASAAALDNGTAFSLVTPLAEQLRRLTDLPVPLAATGPSPEDDLAAGVLQLLVGHADQPPDAPQYAELSLISDVLAEARRLWADPGPDSAPAAREIVQSFVAGLHFLLVVRVLFCYAPHMVKRLISLDDCGRPGDGRPAGAAPRWLAPYPVALSDLVAARAALRVSPHLSVACVNEACRNLAIDH